MRKTILDIVEIFLIGSTVSALVFFFIGQPVRVIGDSMIPTFENSEQLIAEKLSLRKTPIRQGEIVIFEHPNYKNVLLIKRVIGLPGDTITITNGGVTLNNTTLMEDYLAKDTVTKGYGKLDQDQELTIPENKFVVLGDNRENSSDSREWGLIDKKAIVGRGFLVYYPFSNIRLVRD